MRYYDDPTLYTAHRWARPYGMRVKWLIIHDPGKDDARPTQIWRFLRNNVAKSCYHRLLWDGPSGPECAVLAPYSEWVGHAGVSTRIPRTTIVDRAVNYWTVSLSVCTYGRPHKPGNALFEATADEAAAAIRALGLPDAGVVLGHREISTKRGRRTDPRGIDMEQLRAAIAARLR